MVWRAGGKPEPGPEPVAVAVAGPGPAPGAGAGSSGSAGCRPARPPGGLHTCEDVSRLTCRMV